MVSVSYTHLDVYKRQISLTAHHHSDGLNPGQKMALSFIGFGFLLQLVYWLGFRSEGAGLWLWSSIGLVSAGSLWYTINQYKNTLPGIKNNHNWLSSLTSRGSLAWILAIFLTGFYILLYWYPEFLGLAKEGENNRGLVALFDPLSYGLKGKPASQWFVYGCLLYTSRCV